MITCAQKKKQACLSGMLLLTPESTTEIWSWTVCVPSAVNHEEKRWWQWRSCECWWYYPLKTIIVNLCYKTSLFSFFCVNTLRFGRSIGTFQRPDTKYYFLKFTYWLYITWQTNGDLTWLSAATTTTTTQTHTHRVFVVSEMRYSKEENYKNNICFWERPAFICLMSIWAYYWLQKRRPDVYCSGFSFSDCYFHLCMYFSWYNCHMYIWIYAVLLFCVKHFSLVCGNLWS